MPKTIPQMEPSFDHREIKAVTDYMESGGWIMEFKKTQELEKMICDFTGAKHCVMTINGTIALIIALLALELKPSDEILIPNLTMIASPNSAVLLGIKPIFIDIDPTNLCLDLSKAKKALNQKTKALMYVPLNGRSGNMKEVVNFCKANKLFLVEDAAQALGSYYQNKHLGTFGDIGTLSFSVPKIITTGQGGALLTDNTKLYNKIQKIKNFGRATGGTDTHDTFGWNFKFTDIQAVIGIEQFKKLPKRIIRKRQIYNKYHSILKDIPQVKFINTDLSQTTPWFIDIYAQSPSNLAAYLEKKGIKTRRIYPAINTQKIFRKQWKSHPFPTSQKIARQGLWLPSSVKLTSQEISLIANSIKQYYS